MTPQLRFPEFTDEWQAEKLDNVLSLVVDNRGKTPPVQDSGIPLIEVNAIGDSRSVKYKNVSKFVSDTTYATWFRKHLQSGDVLFSTVGQTALVSQYLGEEMATIAQNIVGLRADENTGSDFLYYLLSEKRNNHKFKQIEMVAVQPSVKVSQMIHLSFRMPQKPEQQKIADFLGGIDSKLTSTQTKVAAMHEYKKGVMQALFSGKFRFKDENGNPYPDWEEKRLGDLVKFHRGNLLSKSDIVADGRHKCIHYGELFTEYNEVIDNVKSRTNLNTKSMSKIGDILMPTSDVTPQGLAKASVINEDGVMLGGDINVLRPSLDINPTLLSYMMNFQKKKIMRLVTGTTVRHVYSKDIAKIIYQIPSSIEEQQKIADFLSSLDDKIKLEEAKLASSKEFKKALLQRMFV